LEVDRGFVALLIVWGYIDLNGKDVERKMLRRGREIGRWNHRIVWRG